MTRAFGSAVVLSLAIVTLSSSAARGTATIRPDGLLDVDGAPFFPVGLVDLGYWRFPSDWNDRIRQTGANVVWDVDAAYADTIPSCTDIVDSASATGYRLIIGAGDTWNWDDLSTPELEVDRRMYEMSDIPALLQCLGTAPGLTIGYANRDEPSWTLSRGLIGNIDAAHIQETYDQLHQDLGADFVAMNFAPVHLSGSLDQWKADILPFLDATDVVMHASYPYPAGPGTCTAWNVMDYPACSMDRLVMAADTFLGELNRPGQPLWMIVQAYKNIPLKEARWEAHAAIVHGATGLFWGGWTWAHPLGNGWDMWDTTVQVVRETVALHPFLVGADLPVSSDRPEVEVRALGSGSVITVFAVSRGGYTGPATIQLPQTGRGRRSVIALYEQRQLAAQQGSLVDSFAAYESHVYQYQANRTLEDVEPLAAGDVTAAPERFGLTAFPNPSSGRTVLRFELPRDAGVLLSVYDAAGRRVAVPGRGTWAAGTGEVTWNGRDTSGHPVAPGVYFVRARASTGETASARVLIRR
jgi:hypothetical protein